MNNMGITVGSTIVHRGETFTTFHIKLEETTQGKVLLITAYDPSMAETIQGQQLQGQAIQQDMLDFVQNMFKKGKDGGGPGFILGGGM